MSQTGFTPISLYYSATTTNVPTAGNLTAGELALNTADGKLFYKDSSNVVQVLGTKGGVGSSTTTQVLYNSSNLVVGSANLTFNGTTLTANTIGAYTLGGTVSGGGNQINNVIIGTVTPLAGSFTAITGSSDATINGQTVGKGAGNISSNTAHGTSALAANTTGINNTAVGYQAGKATTDSSGVGVTFFGSQAGLSNTTGYNDAFGVGALQLVVTGNSNAAFGYGSLNKTTTSGNSGFGFNTLGANTTGNSNTSVGASGLSLNTTGSSNTAIGREALQANTTASSNTAVGYQAGYNITTAGTNTLLGGLAGSGLQTGGNNVYIGYTAGPNVVTSASGGANVGVGYATLYSLSSGAYNTGLGQQALYSNTTASNNTAVGYQAGYTNITGTQNAYFGYQAGNLATGSWNAFLGYQAGAAITTGYQSTFVGRFAGSAVTTGNSNVIIGAYTGSAAPISATGSNYIVLSDGDGNVRQTITNTGDVGIGTTAPSRKLNVRSSGVMFANNGGEHSLLLGDEAYAYWNLYTPVSPTYLSFQYNSVEKMKVDSSGNLTLTGKLSTTGGVTVRTVAVASASPILPTSDTADQYNVTALAAGVTVSAPSGTPTNGQKLTLRIKDDGTARALTWTTSSGGYRVIGTTLPTTTVISKTVYIGCIYNSTDVFWDVVAVAQQA